MAKCAICLESTRGDGYENHVCEKTGFKPTEIEHQDALTDGRFSKISESAIKRGADRKAKKSKK